MTIKYFTKPCKTRRNAYTITIVKTQTCILLPKLTTMLAAPMSDVPNTAGFKLLGILKNGPAIPLTVAVDANGCHYLADQNHSHRATHIFSGWVKDNAV